MTKFIYQPRSESEKFGQKIYDLLVENSAATFYVGGMVRNLLLQKKVTDIDIATKLKPDDVINIMRENALTVNISAKQFGTITVTDGKNAIEVTTFRTEAYDASRYPKVRFADSPSADSKRRDFTINALYLSQKNGLILDFHHGLEDIRDKKIRFIGNPTKRIKEDSLRIIRALRFALSLNLKLEKNTYSAVKNNLPETKKLTDSRMQTEIKKIKSKKQKNILTEVLKNFVVLDKYFNHD